MLYNNCAIDGWPVGGYESRNNTEIKLKQMKTL